MIPGDFDPTRVTVGLVKDSDTAHDFIEWIKTVPDQLIGLDVETSGLNWFDGELKLVQFGTLYEGWAVPFQDFKHLVREALRILTERKKFFVGHNFKFDLHWLERHAGWLPSDWMFVHDTMNMAAVLNSSGSKALKDLAEFFVWSGAKDGQNALKEDLKRGGWDWATVPVTLPSYWIYGVIDTILTVNLFYTLHTKAVASGCLDAYETERAAMPVLYKIERKGMLLDREHCEFQQSKLMQRADDIDHEVVTKYGVSNIDSTSQLALAFLDAGIELTEKTDTGKWKMDKDTFDLIAATNDHPLVNLVKEYRSAKRMAVTYYGNFLEFQRSDGRCHSFYRPVVARTGRMSADSPAILTVPRPDSDASDAIKQVRNSFVAPDGHVYISSDFSNVEARIFAHFADELGMKQAFLDGVNLHKFTASQMFGKPIEEIDKSAIEYTLAKNSLFGKLFGAGVGQLARTAGVSYEKAAEADAGLNRAFPGMQKFQREAVMEATDNLKNYGQAFIRGIDGRILAMVETDERYYAFTNWKIQSTACIVLKRRLAVADAMGIADYFVAAIHDEVVAEVPEEDESDYRHAITEAMTDTEMFSLPIVCATGEGSSRWGEAKG